jgi:transcriptional regulator with XRE-family HTH domain
MEGEPHGMSPARAAHPAGRGAGDRARLGFALREARQSAGLSGTEAGRRAGMSQSKVSKIERGFLLPSVDDVTALCRAYQVPARERAALVRLATGLREELSARVILSRGAAEMQRRIGQLEASSTLIRGYQPALVDGLLQTEAYVRLIFDVPNSQPPNPEAVDEAVFARLERQRLLDDETRRFVLIMTEGALRWHAGSSQLMAEQVDVISEAVRRPKVKLGIIPWTTPVRIFPVHGFSMYDDDAVVVGTKTATAFITGAADIATYAELFAALEGVAAFGDEAAEHLRRIAADYRKISKKR